MALSCTQIASERSAEYIEEPGRLLFVSWNISHLHTALTATITIDQLSFHNFFAHLDIRLQSMSRNFSVTEPHPSVPRSGGYVGGGRGGAGNYKHYTADELSSGPSATGPASRVSLTRALKRTMPGGRGGAGNMFTPSATEISMFQFDEEMVKQREPQAPVYHIGRGGAANFVKEPMPKANRTSSTTSAASISSERSNSSVRDVFGKLTRKLSSQ